MPTSRHRFDKAPTLMVGALTTHTIYRINEIMNRRIFLSRVAAVVGAALVGPAVAQMNAKHGGHAMPANNHNGHDMSAMNHDMGGMCCTKGQTLLSTSALPQGLALPALKPLNNLSGLPGVFEAELRAAPVNVALTSSLTTEFWAYNDSVPGPAIEVFEGDTVNITVKNDLPQPTTVHWHGLPVPADQDGNPQDAIEPGGSRVYRFTLPQGCAGTYWYHPHGHNTVSEQVYRGLAGTFIVRAKNDPLAHLPEQQWLISDLKLAENGEIADNTMMDWMNGREGQFTLINGAYRPKIDIKETTRVRLWNANSGRYLHLNLNDFDAFIVGSDGGLLAKPSAIDSLFLSPGERAEVVLTPKKTGSVSLMAMAYDRGKMGTKAAERDLIIAELTLTQAKSATLPATLRQLPDLGKPTAFKTLEYTETMDMGKGMSGMKFMINGKMHDMDRIDLISKAGELEEWTIFNNSHMDHNFHIHGTQFQVIEHELNGHKQPPDYVALKDTVNLKPYETIRIKIVQQMKGIRMYHCHILEHETIGMMGQLKVI
jgi:suppressor of ftsI